MRNLKKAVSGFLVSAVLLTSLVPAFAASYTYEAEARTLYDLQLFKGVSTDPNVFDPALDLGLDRQSGVIMMLRLVGEMDAAEALTMEEADEILSNYMDASEVADWAKKGMAYAVENGLVQGTSVTTLSPTEDFLGKMFAGLILRNIGYEVNAETYNTAAALLAEKGGLTSAEAIKFNDKELIRDDLVGMAYGSLKAAYAETAMTIIETLVAEGKVDEAKAIEAGLITAAVPAISEVKAVGAKKLEVKFAKAVDPTKSFSIKRGSIAANIAKTTFAADNKSAVVELATNLIEGEYTISFDTLTATMTAENEKVTKVEFTSDKAVFDKTDKKVVSTGYKVYNQYNEDVTKTAVIEFASGKGTTTYVDGKLTITASTEFTKDEMFSVSALHVATTTFASAVLTVSDKAQVSDVEIISLYNMDDKELDVNSVYSDYKLIVEAKDQYGNAVPYGNIADDVMITISNESVVKVGLFAEETIDGVKRVVLPLAAPDTTNAGTARIMIISRTTGDNTSIDVTVKEAAKVDAISLQAPEFTVAGEEIEIPFTAIDQFGNVITDATKGLTAITPTLSDSSVTAAFTQDYVKGTPKLTVDATSVTDSKSVVMNIMTPTGKLAQMTLNLAAPAKATVVSGTKDVSNKLLVGGTTEMDIENVIVKDQYGRDMEADVANYKVVVATSEAGKVSIVDDVYNINTNDVTVKLKGLAKGSSTITLKAQNPDGTDVVGSEYQMTVAVVEKKDIVSYELADMGKVYSAATTPTDYAVEVKVNGILADGSKVKIPYTAENYKITENIAGFAVTADSKVYADSNFVFADDKTEKDITIVVTVIGETETSVLTKTVTVTKAESEAAKLELRTNGIATKESDGVVSVAVANAEQYSTIAADAVKVTDQYGKVITPELTVIPTNVPSELVAGKAYNLTVITDNSQVITFKVILK